MFKVLTILFRFYNIQIEIIFNIPYDVLILIVILTVILTVSLKYYNPRYDLNEATIGSAVSSLS